MNLPRALFLCALMISTALAAAALTPKELLAEKTPSIDLEAAIPLAFGDWQYDPSVAPVTPSPQQKETLEQIYDQTVNRTYVNSRGQRIMLSVAHGSAQNRKLRVHRQEVCYAAQGFQIKDIRQDDQTIAGVPVPLTRMIAVQGARTEPVTYWFTMGSYLVRSYLDRQMVQLKYAVSGYVPDGYLFRVSSIDADSAAAFESQMVFSRELIEKVSPQLRNKLLGSG